MKMINATVEIICSFFSFLISVLYSILFEFFTHNKKKLCNTQAYGGPAAQRDRVLWNDQRRLIVAPGKKLVGAPTPVLCCFECTHDRARTELARAARSRRCWRRRRHCDHHARLRLRASIFESTEMKSTTPVSGVATMFSRRRRANASECVRELK